MTDYPAGMTLRPIVAWPGEETRERSASNFSAPWRATLDLLDRELHFLGEGNRNAPAVLQIAMREQDFRIDGLPRASARPAHPGVILAIESSNGPLSFPCDRFITWQDNLRAIALALEALRKIDRYGVTRNAEQYTGWKQLGSADAPVPMSAQEAAEFLQELHQRETGRAFTNLREVRRAVIFACHPDRGGSRETWDRIESAIDVLRKAGRL